jgi:hypothetical protein
LKYYGERVLDMDFWRTHILVIFKASSFYAE